MANKMPEYTTRRRYGLARAEFWDVFRGEQWAAEFGTQADAEEYVRWKSAGNPQAEKVRISEVPTEELERQGRMNDYAGRAIFEELQRRAKAEPERSDERVEEIKCTKCGQLVLLSQRLLIEWPAEVKCAQDSAPCDGEVRLIPYCERHDPRNGSR